MSHGMQLNDYDNHNLYAFSSPDELGVLSSTRRVVEQAEHVRINSEQIAVLRDRLMHGLNTPPSWYERYHYSDGTERTVNWLLVLDALNFCFWAEKGQPRWQIEYQGELLNGYWAEAAALTRAVEEGMPLWDAEYLSTISREELLHIFRPARLGARGAIHLDRTEATTGAVIPLFEQRLENIHEVGRVLLERYEGQFTRAIEQAGGSAVRLALLLARDFSSFRDIASYRGSEVHFFKRAQICVADLHGSFGGKRWGAFRDLDQLTVFADYKLPQVLRHFGVLEYAPALAMRVDNQELLAAGEEEEVEIRAATIWACEFLRGELGGLLLAAGRTITAAEVDERLWHLGQDVPEMKPYHRVRTVYY